MLNKPIRLLCIDYGNKFMGFAVADFPGITARALDTVRPDRVEIIAAIRDIVVRENIGKILLGFPYSEIEGDIHRKIHAFKFELESANPQVPVEYIDESYSSQEADDLLKETSLGKKRKTRAQDSEAAKLVLLRYLRQS